MDKAYAREDAYRRIEALETELAEAKARELEILAENDALAFKLNMGHKEAYENGFAEGRERAAEVTELWPGNGGFIAVNDPTNPTDCMNSLRKGIVTAIRALRPGGE